MSIDLRPVQRALAAFEQVAFGRDSARAIDAGLALCEAIQQAQNLQVDGTVPATVYTQLCTRAAAAWVTCLAHDEHDLSIAQLIGLANHRYTFLSLFAGSGYGSTRVLLDVMGKQGPDQRVHYSPRAVMKLASTLSAELLPRECEQVALRHPAPVVRAACALGWLAQGVYTDSAAEALCNRLLEQHATFTADLSGMPSLLLLRVWMCCSYATTSKKHAIKSAIGAELAARLPTVTPAVPQGRNRPVLLVAAEALHSRHPVYRCYAPILRDLRKHFHTVLLCQQRFYDEATTELFDEVVGEMGTPTALQENLPRIAALAPDVVFFPAVGMVEWSVALANRRLAPIQVMAMGHPATSMSPHMDYVVLPEEFEPAAGSFSERVLLLPGQLAHEPFPGLPDDLPRSDPTETAIVKVALNSTYLKLSPSFLAACKEIAARSSRPIEFHVFPARHSVYWHALNEQFQRVLPGCKVYENVDYLTHLKNLSRCQVSLAAFPFGNSNSTVDAFLVGMPVVAMMSPEPHGMTDARKFGPFNLPDWLLVSDREHYIESALRLIESADERRKVSEQLSPARVKQLVYSLGAPDRKGMDLSGGLTWLVANHARLANHPKRVWRVTDAL